MLDGDGCSDRSSQTEPRGAVEFAGSGKDLGRVLRRVWQKIVFEEVMSNLAAEGQAIAKRAWEMDATVKAGLADFFGASPKAPVGAARAGKTIGWKGEFDPIAAVEVSEDDRTRAAEGAVAGDVFWKGGGVEERQPVGIGGGGIIGVIGSSPNGSDGTPEIVNVFGVPTCDGDIAEGNVEDGEEFYSLLEGKGARGGDGLGGLIPMARRRHGVAEVAPKMGGLGLMGAASGAAGGTKVFHGIEIRGVLRAVEGRRARRAELGGADERERNDASPMLHFGRANKRRGAPPGTDIFAGDVREAATAMVVHAPGDPRIRNGASEAEGFGTPGTFRGAGEKPGIEVTKSGGAAGKKIGGGGKGGAVQGGIEREIAWDIFGGVKRLGAMDGSGGVEHCAVDDGKGAGGDARVGVFRADGIEECVIP